MTEKWQPTDEDFKRIDKIIDRRIAEGGMISWWGYFEEILGHELFQAYIDWCSRRDTDYDVDEYDDII